LFTITHDLKQPVEQITRIFILCYYCGEYILEWRETNLFIKHFVNVHAAKRVLNIDREFEFYEFVSFLKFYEFYEKKIGKNS